MIDAGAPRLAAVPATQPSPVPGYAPIAWIALLIAAGLGLELARRRKDSDNN